MTHSLPSIMMTVPVPVRRTQLRETEPAGAVSIVWFLTCVASVTPASLISTRQGQ